MKAILVIGSNCGDRERMIADTIGKLGSIGEISRQSDIYETPDCLGSGMKYQNAVIEFITSAEENELNLAFKAYERQAGRNSECRQRGEVPLDIDIVVCDGIVRRPKDYCATYFRRGLEKLR